MKKIWILALTFISIGMVFLSCLFDPGDSSQINMSELTRKDSLALSHLKKSHVIEEETLRYQLNDFLQEDSNGRSVNSTSSIITGVTKFSGKPVKQFSTKNIRSVAADTEEMEIPFYLYTIENSIEDTEGFAIACGDERIGDILAVVENGVFDEDNPFLAIFYSNLDGYIEETIDIYNSINDEDIEIAIQKNAMSSRAVISNETSDPSVLLITRWGQSGSPVWDIINEMYGRTNYGYNDKYVTGCVMTASAQIMAFHEYPKICSAPGYTDIIYNWKDMKTHPYPYSLTSNAQRSVAALMYELGLKAPNTQYGTGDKGTSATLSTEIFSKMGYETPSSLQSYNYETIKSSIIAKKPVAIRGNSHKEHHETKFLWWVVKSWDTYKNGHAWVVDGYRTRNSTAYVHCNLGWYNTGDGWYTSGVFNTNDVPEATRTVGTNYYYAYNIQIIPHITKP
jgi:hypothetical protein